MSESFKAYVQVIRTLRDLRKGRGSDREGGGKAVSEGRTEEQNDGIK